MPLTIKSGGSQTIEDYVIKCGDVPLMGSRNKDRTLIIGEFKMKVSETIGAAHRALNNLIEVSMDSIAYPQFIGKIVVSERDEATRAYDLTVRSVVAELQDWTVSYDNLHTDLLSGLDMQTLGNYWTDDYSSNGSIHDWPSARIDFIVSTMFSHIFTGTYSDLSFVFETDFEDEIVDTIFIGNTNRTMLFKHLRLDENMLYCLNQSFAANQTRTDHADNSDNRITYFDFISAFCGYFNCKIELETTGLGRRIIMSFITDEDGITLNDDNIYKQKENIIETQGGGTKVDLLFWHGSETHWRAAYINTIENSLGSHSEITGGGRTLITLMANFLCLYDRHWDDPPSGTTECITLTSTNYPAMFYSGLQMGTNKANVINNSNVESIYETDLTFHNNARINAVKVADRKLKTTYMEYS